jgi:nitrous oxidase accessory protein
MRFEIAFVILILVPFKIWAAKYYTVANSSSSDIINTLKKVKDYDTIYIKKGHYKEGNIKISRPLTIIGLNYPIIDGELKYELISIASNDVIIKGLKLINSGHSALDDPCAIKVYNASNIVIEHNIFENNFFGIYIQEGHNCLIRNNKLNAEGINEHEIGNGIHAWKSTDLKIVANTIKGHRDGIYFEFVTHSVIWRNIAENNIRYGLHFMFSNDDAYFTNTFRANGAGVAVMYSKKVVMINNKFENNWGAAAYGLLLKDITDSTISGNHFLSNTMGILMEGSNRIEIDKNIFNSNGWALRVQASCMENKFYKNDFLNNTFDIGTNGSVVLNNFDHNYWDKYKGYDLNKDNIGDVPYRPLSLYSVIIEKNNAAMLLFRSLFITLLDRSEKIFPTITPENFIDNYPSMKANI